jgi:UDP-N-acetylmuramoylalanine--D-glutamate ligase
MNAFPSDLFAGKRFAVVGLGRNGLPAAKALLAMGADVVAWDDSPAARDAAAGTPLVDPLQGAFAFDALVLSPGIPHSLPAPHPVAVRAKQARIPILSDAELLFQAVRASGSRARFVGITGTNGKSTTTALLAHILTSAGRPVAAGGNLGPAALALPLLPDDGTYVLEMSSYMLERLATLRFDLAAMLNLSADHLDRHGDMAGYAAAKRGIFARQQPGDTAVLGVDDDETARTAVNKGIVRLTISGTRKADVWYDSAVLRDAAGAILDMREAPSLPGAHNAQNAAAAFAIATQLGVPRTDIAGAIAAFPGLAHRQQRVGSIGGVLFINDSKATNADAAARALGCYDRILWIAGGIAKEGGIEPLAPFFPRIAHALLIGRDAPQLATTLTAHGVPHDQAGTLEHAVPAALEAARRTGAPVVLLSPACASFDQFSGFDARGDRFAALVEQLAQARAA